MGAPVEWLEAQVEKAKTRLEEAQKQYDSCVEVLKLARSEAPPMTHVVGGAAPPSSPSGTIAFPKRKEKTLSVPNHAAQLLKSGPMKTSEIHERLKRAGRDKTTPNSINTALNRYRPKRFDRDSEGRWFLVEKT